MPTKKTTPANAELQPTNTFESEVNNAINNVCASSPELKEIFKDELAALKKRVLNAHNLCVEQEQQSKDMELDNARKTIALMESDINALKTVVLRMAITQYGG